MERETNVKEKSIDETCRERERARHRQALRVQTIILQGESIINNIERGARALDVSLGAPGKQRRRKRKAGMSRSLGNPVKLGHVVTVELKSGELYRGSMIECEDNWNFSLENTYTAKGFVGHTARLDNGDNSN